MTADQDGEDIVEWFPKVGLVKRRTSHAHQLLGTPSGSFRGQMHDSVMFNISKNGQCVSSLIYISTFLAVRSKVLAELVKDFCHFCLDKRISVTPEYLLGTHNYVAD